MFFRDMTISNPIKIPQGSVIVLTLTATGLDPFFIGNLTKQLTNESYSGLAYQFVDIKEGGSINTAIVRLYSQGGGTTTADAIKYLIDEAKAVANITIWGFDVPHVEVISAAQAKKQDAIDEQQKQVIPTGNTTNQSVWDKILGTNQPTKSWGEYLFGISSTQIMLVVGGLGLFLIWTKLPSFKGRR